MAGHSSWFNRKKDRQWWESLPYFSHSWTCHEHNAIRLLGDYPMPYRNELIRQKQVSAVCSVLSNIPTGTQLILPNFSRITVGAFGYSREIFLNVIEHLEKVALVSRLLTEEGSGPCTSSIVTISNRLLRYRPAKRHFVPEGTIILSLKHEEIKNVAKIDTHEKRELNAQLRRYWDFLKQHEIRSNLTDDTFRLCNEYQVEVEKKEPLIRPDEEKYLPYMVFNDSNLTLGGRLYGAFWIGCKSNFRKLITIDGELTADVDGKAMHVQLLYQHKGVELPPGDPYVFTDPARRKIAKKLMLLMLNTKKSHQPAEGREKVLRTYRHHYKGHADKDELAQYIDALESLHWQILDELYKPNWGRLQKTEAAIMLRIIEHGIADDVVILPVHDGCLCPRKDRDRVLGYFEREGIIAAENTKHLRPIPLGKYQEVLRGVREIKQKAA